MNVKANLGAKPAAVRAAHGFGRISQASRDELQHHIDHMGHMLSEQGPMSITFVHNNTLFGLQKYHFEEAIEKAKAFMGGRGYLQNQDYRDHYAVGRITDADIAHVMGRRKDLVADTELAKVRNTPVTAWAVLRHSLVSGLAALPVADLRRAASENRATRQLRADLPAATRATILKNAAADFKAVQASLGKSLTLAGWLQDHLNLDLTGNIRREVTRATAEGGVDGDASDSILQDLQIPTSNWSDYYKAVVALAGGLIPDHGGNRLLNLWLQAERKIVARVARRYFDVDGTLTALVDHVRTNPEEYAAQGLWSAALRHHGLSDPFAAIDGETLQDRDAAVHSSEVLSDSYHYMQRWGGPPLPIDHQLRADIAVFIQGETAALSDAQAGKKSPGQGTIDRAHLCWTVLHDLGENRLNRRGFEALTALCDTPDSLAILARVQANDPRQSMLEFARDSADQDIAALTGGKSHADLLQSLTGENIVGRINDYMIGLCSAFLDEGLAAWHLPGRALGFYESWRNLVKHDRSFDFDGLTGWRESVQDLPIFPVDVVIGQLQSLGIPEANWPDYCGRLLVNLKGWAGMVFWRQLHPNYAKQQANPIDMMQYLAVRLFYQTLLVNRACRKTWQLHSGVEDLAQYFESHPAEYLGRKLLFSGELPDHLAEQARALTALRNGDAADGWVDLADMIWAHRQSDAAARLASDDCWRLFQLAQFLGMDAADLKGLSNKAVKALMASLDSFPESAHGPVWQHAFELHYRDEVLNALTLNRGRGRWLHRTTRPKSQVIFCIDEREESIHRHFEELDPQHETLGAAGFFGVAMDYTGLDDHRHTPLCPAVVTPAHRVKEVARPVDEHLKLDTHQSRTKWLDVFNDTFWEMKRNVVGSYFLIDVAGFMAAYPLLGRVFFPVKYFASLKLAREMFVPTVQTRLTMGRDVGPDGQPVAGSVGFTNTEQADRVEGLLRNLGMIANFAPIVVFCAHGSNSQNNPHENAHDCGACGGKNGAPNSRAMSAMANTPVIRDLLRQRGIIIPDDTWFIGAVHNTASDDLTYYDTEDVPASLRIQFEAVVADLHEASMRAARERCRRFASAPKDATLEQSLHHVQVRATDFSQVRPEWGHATNAFAVVGRRGVTQGVFFDRRPFIISYDPNTDPSGKILERILLAVGPVGAGINLEYYFSTVDPTVYGSDTKVPHNVTGLIGVMEGAHSDLRTGLPRQMTEVHEAMRLNLIVDAPMAILGEIYGRQPGIQELLNGEWVILIAHDPETGAFNQFVPGVGFETWDDSHLDPIPEVADSYAWFKGKYEKFLPPALIREPATTWKNTRT